MFLPTLKFLAAICLQERLCVFSVNVHLTQAAELADDGRERVVHHTLQLAADSLWQLPSAEVPGLDVPLHQRHGDGSHQHKLQGHTGNRHTWKEKQM